MKKFANHILNFLILPKREKMIHLAITPVQSLEGRGAFLVALTCS